MAQFQMVGPKSTLDHRILLGWPVESQKGPSSSSLKDARKANRRNSGQQEPKPTNKTRVLEKLDRPEGRIKGTAPTHQGVSRQ